MIDRSRRLGGGDKLPVFLGDPLLDFGRSSVANPAVGSGFRRSLGDVFQVPDVTANRRFKPNAAGLLALDPPFLDQLPDTLGAETVEKTAGSV